MFGTSGIRGIYGKGVTLELASRVASIFSDGRLVVGRDIRASGPALLDAVRRGANAAGASVIDLGIVPTPTLALATLRHNCRGIMITASHNPPEYNGLKLIEGGKEIGKRTEAEVTRRYKEGEWKGAHGEKGAVFHDYEAVSAHTRLVCRLVDSDAIAKKKPRVVVDCNGAASAITPQLLSDLGCHVVSMNASAHCFNRQSEPSAGNLGYLPALIRKSGVDFAIAHDGDGDRCVVMDESGAILPLDAQLAIMIAHELEREGGGRVVTTVEASLTIRDVVKAGGGEIEITPVGSTYVGDALEGGGALFGGEPCGEYIYRDGVHVPDAVLAAAKFAEIFCKKGGFSRLKTLYPQNPMAREKFHSSDKHAAMERIRKEVAGLGIRGDMRADDGIRLDEKDGWFLIRASGTEPIVRLTMEYKEQKRLGARLGELSAIIRKCL